MNPPTQQFESGTYDLTYYTFPNPSPKGVILMIHGYMDYTLSNKRFIHDLVHEGYTVIGMDLPGHGRSSGDKADIDNFHSYGDCVTKLYTIIMEQYPSLPIIGMGHSTGCSALLDSVWFHKQQFEQLILIAPLIRSFMWEWSKVGTSIAGKFITHLPRIPVDFTHDRNPHIKDEYYIGRAPLHWVNMLQLWEKEVQKLQRTSSIETNSIFAEQDTVVDNPSNNNILQSLFTDYHWVYIPKAYHSMTQEREDFYAPFWAHLTTLL